MEQHLTLGSDSMENKVRSMNRREVVNEISSVTNVKDDIVRSILNAFEDIMIRECVMNGKFKFRNGFSVDTHVRKERKQYNVQTGQYIKYPETKVLNISLSPKINNFHRWKQRNEFNEKHGLTIEDWRKMKEELEEQSKKEKQDKKE